MRTKKGQKSGNHETLYLVLLKWAKPVQETWEIGSEGIAADETGDEVICGLMLQLIGAAPLLKLAI